MEKVRLRAQKDGASADHELRNGSNRHGTLRPAISWLPWQERLEVSHFREMAQATPTGLIPLLWMPALPLRRSELDHLVVSCQIKLVSWLSLNQTMVNEPAEGRKD